jgi:hypothetical protein
VENLIEPYNEDMLWALYDKLAELCRLGDAELAHGLIEDSPADLARLIGHPFRVHRLEHYLGEDRERLHEKIDFMLRFNGHAPAGRVRRFAR